MAKNLIYQYWSGNPPTEAAQSRKLIGEWADRIGAEHMFELNPVFKNVPGGKLTIPNYYTAFRPLFDPEFDEYDNILFLDCDIFPVRDLDVDIFAQGYKGIGIVDEPHKEKIHQTTTSHLNSKNDEKWAKMVKEKWGKEVLRNDEGQVKIYNTGVVLYDRDARKNAQENWLPFQTYIDWCNGTNGLPTFYRIDQNYLITMMLISEYTVMDAGWNCFVHYNGDKDITGHRPVWDGRAQVEEPKLVHVQLRGADDKNERWHDIVVNEPVEKWLDV
jgi:lipopolysaccharide biosynthesis glycosyltransferase